MYRPGFGSGFDPTNPNHLLHASRMNRRPIQRFDEFYRAYPMIMAPGERPHLDYGSKVILPPSALDTVSKLHVQWPLLMEAMNGEKGKHSHCGVLEFVAEEGRVYIPQWMMVTLGLDVGDMIQLRTTSLELAQLVRLQPQSVSFLEISDPRAVLEKVFRSFATLTKGDLFNFEYNDEIFEIAVLDVKPESEKMGVCMIETDVSVDFAAPIGYVEPERQTRGSGTSTPRSGMGGGATPAGGLLRHQGTMAANINYDAIAPGTARAAASKFVGEGKRLSKKKARKTAQLGTAAPADLAAPPEDAGGSAEPPMPLRLGSNRLFFGYDIRPVKTEADKVQEAAAAKAPHFAGRGQSVGGKDKK